MQNWWIFGIGFIAQGLFSSRFLVQWLASERAKTVIVPTTFWLCSLSGSIIMMLYGILRSDLPIVLGQCLTYAIYCRNLKLQFVWEKYPIWVRGIIIITPLIFLLLCFSTNPILGNLNLTTQTFPFGLLVFGILAQLIFLFRFVYQWFYSEVQKSSKLPLGFWILSILGAFLIMVYGLKRQDLVLILAHSFGIFIYSRNIFLMKTSNQKPL